MAKKIKEGRKTLEPTYQKELGVYSYKDRSKEFEKPKKGTNIIKQLEDDKLEFDPHIKFVKSDPEKGTIKGFKIGKKGGSFYFEKKFKKGGVVKKDKKDFGDWKRPKQKKGLKDIDTSSYEKFKKGGRVCKVKPKLAKRGYK